MVVLLEGSPISTEEHWSSVRVTIGFLVNSLTKALLPRCSVWFGRPALGRAVVMNREVKERRREEDKRVPLPLQNKRDAPPEKDRPARAHIDLQGSPHTTPN
ncbi:hypothetical protein NQZ68_020488 [Dissostichus eleginoides]|nr:hypothetical protein NQZ68_020488 [Dissostichus eleginoides]